MYIKRYIYISPQGYLYPGALSRAGGDISRASEYDEMGCLNE